MKKITTIDVIGSPRWIFFQGPTRRRSRANGGGTTGKGKKAMALAQQQHQDQRDAKEGKRGIKGRHTQSVW